PDWEKKLSLQESMTKWRSGMTRSGPPTERSSNQNMHKPVLLHESIAALNLSPGQTFLDGTLGSGGHSAEVVKKFGDKVTIFGLDRDEEALKRSEERLRTLGAKYSLRHKSFRNLDEALEESGI